MELTTQAESEVKEMAENFHNTREVSNNARDRLYTRISLPEVQSPVDKVKLNNPKKGVGITD